MTTTRDEIVAQHIMKDTHNLELALDVVAAYPIVRDKLIRDAMAKIKHRLQEHFASTELEIEDSFTVDPAAKYATFVMRDPSWPAGLRVGLQADRREAGYLFLGVHVADDATVPEGLNDALDVVRRGLTSPAWPWYYWLEGPHLNWNTKEALLLLRAGETVNVVSTGLIEVARALSRFVNPGQ